MKKVYKVKVNGKVYEIELEEVKVVDGKVEVEQKQTVVEAPKAAPVAQSSVKVESSGAKIEAQMPGTIIDVKVKVGDTINEGDLIAIIEAMKMEMEIFADKGGTVSAVNISKGTSVNQGDAIVVL